MKNGIFVKLGLGALIALISVQAQAFKSSRSDCKGAYAYNDSVSEYRLRRSPTNFNLCESLFQIEMDPNLARPRGIPIFFFGIFMRDVNTSRMNAGFIPTAETPRFDKDFAQNESILFRAEYAAPVYYPINSMLPKVTVSIMQAGKTVSTKTYTIPVDTSLRVIARLDFPVSSAGLKGGRYLVKISTSGSQPMDFPYFYFNMNVASSEPDAPLIDAPAIGFAGHPVSVSCTAPNASGNDAPVEMTRSASLMTGVFGRPISGMSSAKFNAQSAGMDTIVCSYKTADGRTSKSASKAIQLFPKPKASIKAEIVR